MNWYNLIIATHTTSPSMLSYLAPYNGTAIIEYLRGPDLQVDGSKGIGLNFKKTSNQLRQTILLVSSNNWITKVAPLEEFNDSENNLNTLGLSYNQTECKVEE